MAQVPLEHGKIGSVSVTKLPDGRWRARARVGYRDDIGLTSFQVSRTTQTKTKAKASIPDAAASALEAKKKATRDPATPETMAQLLRAWRDGLDDAGIHGRTRQDYGYAVAALLGEPKSERHTKGDASRAGSPTAKAFAKIAKLAPKDVTQGHVKALLVAVANSSGPGAAERVRTVLRNAFHQARDYGLTTENPAIGLTYRRSDADDYRTKAKRDDGLDHGRAPTDSEVTALLSALLNDPRAGRQEATRTRSAKGGKYANPQDIADLTWFLFSIGSRLGETLALRWCDINLSDADIRHTIERINPETKRQETVTITLPPGHVSINATVARIVGHGGGLVRDVTKSPAGCRVIPLSKSAQEMLTARAEAMGVPHLARPHRPVFGGLTKPESYRDPSAVTKVLAFLYNAHHVTWHRSHGARKYVTTKLHRSGFDDNRIMRYMGWSNPATLQKYLDRKQDLPVDMATALDLARPGPGPLAISA